MGAGADAMSGDGERMELIPPMTSRRPDDASYDSTGKSPQQIENDITETRAELGEILDALERKLAPRHLLERGVDMLKNRMSGDDSGLAGTLRGHPVPLALIGLGIGWMLMSASSRSQAGSYGKVRERVTWAVRDATERAEELAKEAQEKVAAARQGIAPEPYPTESAGYAYARHKPRAKIAETAAAASSALQDRMRQARQASTTAWGRAGDYAGEAGQRLQGARDRFTELVEEYPFAFAALGFVAGSLIALALPRTRTEEQIANSSGVAQIREQAMNLGREAVERVQQAAERTVDTVSDVVTRKAEETKS
jgi:hypothetical protein